MTFKINLKGVLDIISRGMKPVTDVYYTEKFVTFNYQREV